MIIAWLYSIIAETPLWASTARIDGWPILLLYLILSPFIVVEFVTPGLFGGVAVIIFSVFALPQKWQLKWRLLASFSLGALFTLLSSVWMLALKRGNPAVFDPGLIPISFILDVLLLLGVGLLIGQMISWYWKKKKNHRQVLVFDTIALFSWTIFILSLFIFLQQWCYRRTWEPIMTITAHIRNLCLDSADTSGCPADLAEVKAFRSDYFEFMGQCQVEVEYQWDEAGQSVKWRAEIPHKIKYLTQEQNRAAK